MVEYSCEECGKKFGNRKSHYITHKNKKYPCVNNIFFAPKNINFENNVPKSSANILDLINLDKKEFYDINIKQELEINNENVYLSDDNDDSDNITKIICKYCFTSFSRNSNLNKHLKNSCKVKKQHDEEKENIFKKLLEQENTIKYKDEQIKTLIGKINILEEKVEQISKITKQNSKINKTKSSGKNIINNNITNNTTNTNTNNNNNGIIFNLVNYGKEDLDKIDIKYFINNIVKNNKVCGVKIPEEILKIIHFNPAYPELNNIYISDINREKCMIYDDGMWKLSPDDKIPEVIDKVVKFSYDKDNQIRIAYPNNKPLIDRLNTINKYTKFNDPEYLEELKEEQEVSDEDRDEYGYGYGYRYRDRDRDGDENNYANNDKKHEIKRCEDFKKKTYNVFKTTLYNEGVKIKNKIK